MTSEYWIKKFNPAVPIFSNPLQQSAALTRSAWDHLTLRARYEDTRIRSPLAARDSGKICVVAAHGGIVESHDLTPEFNEDIITCVTVPI